MTMCLNCSFGYTAGLLYKHLSQYKFISLTLYKTKNALHVYWGPHSTASAGIVYTMYMTPANVHFSLLYMCSKSISTLWLLYCEQWQYIQRFKCVYHLFAGLKCSDDVWVDSHSYSHRFFICSCVFNREWSQLLLFTFETTSMTIVYLSMCQRPFMVE